MDGFITRLMIHLLVHITMFFRLLEQKSLSFFVERLFCWNQLRGMSKNLAFTKKWTQMLAA